MAGETKQSTGSDRRAADEMPLVEIVAEDFNTHQKNPISPGFWALAVHRLGARVERVDAPLAKKSLDTVHHLLATGVDWMWGIKVPRHTRVGRRVHIWHFGSLLLNARSIGDDVHIRHDTTFGPLRAHDANDVSALPVIGSNVEVGSGACVLGGIAVGDGARVGANTVVIEPVAAGATVFGVPSRVIAT
ncbi:MAG: transferase [Polyangiales bacterium]